LVLLTFPLCFLIFIAHTVPMSRYLDAMLPMLAAAAGLGAVTVGSFFRSRATAATTAIVVAACLPGLLLSIRSNQFFAQPDTRSLARDFIEREVPSGATVLTQPYSAGIKTSREALVEALRTNLGDERKASVKFQWQMKVSASPAYRTILYGDGGTDVDRIFVLPSEVEQQGLAALRRHNISYVVLKRSNVPNPETAALEAGLRTEADLLATFSPYAPGTDPATQASVSPYFHNTAARIYRALDRPGPIVEVWRLRGSAHAASLVTSREGMK
jgi:hypothetical protein